MIAPIRPNAPPAMAVRHIPEERECCVREPQRGERCYAILLYTPPRKSTWRPRVADAIPPMHRGKKLIWAPAFDGKRLLADIRQANARRMKEPGRISAWYVLVELICGYDETAQPVDLMIGGVN